MTLARLNNGKNTLICIVIFSWSCQLFVKFFEDLERKKKTKTLCIITHKVTQASFCLNLSFGSYLCQNNVLAAEKAP